MATENLKCEQSKSRLRERPQTIDKSDCGGREGKGLGLALGVRTALQGPRISTSEGKGMSFLSPWLQQVPLGRPHGLPAASAAQAPPTPARPRADPLPRSTLCLAQRAPSTHPALAPALSPPARRALPCQPAPTPGPGALRGIWPLKEGVGCGFCVWPWRGGWHVSKDASVLTESRVGTPVASALRTSALLRLGMLWGQLGPPACAPCAHA